MGGAAAGAELRGSIVAALVLALLVGASIRRLGVLPPLGPFLDPAQGAWSAARQDRGGDSEAQIPGLVGPVQVHFDDRQVPHIFATTELDAIRALGYVVARDRLFQLELQWRAGAGRITELAGPVALRSDQEMRRVGLPAAAEAHFAALPDTSTERRLLEAFADGVNGWMDGMGSRGIPFEYHLLGRRPVKWEPINSLYLLGRMGWTLATSDLERIHEAAVRLVGESAADALYPRDSPIQEPIEPNGQIAPRFDDHTIPPPVHPSGPLAVGLPAGSSRPAGAGFDALGSNNWAVAPSRSATGHALLAGDPHLELTLPSIWYEAHLVVPGSLDVYGVTIPGTPGIVIGFNRDVAWTFTNTEADVLDRYLETVDDSTAPSRYRLDGAWRPLRTSVEVYHDQRGGVIAVDTLRYTHRGPLRRDPWGRWTSTRWTVLEENHALRALNRGAHATDAADWLDRMLDYRAPPQNMLVADRAGTIAIRSTGRFPIRPLGRGDRFQPGDSAGVDWTGEWSAAELPQALNPRQGYLASANQQPVDPKTGRRYLGANWYSPWRAMRINTLLRGDSAVTPEAMRRFQTDPGSEGAEIFVPAFLAAARRSADEPRVRRAASLLSEWDRRYTRENSRAVLYESAMDRLGDLLWDELRPDSGATRLPNPGNALVAILLRDSASAWWDRRETRGVVERRDAILATALAEGLDRVIERFGEPENGGWRWDRVRFATIHHLLYIPALSREGIPLQGGQGTLNPSSADGSFGSSWRMVVELGPTLRAFGIYPGGQSGNPASRRYDDRVSRWSNGELDTLRLPGSPAELGAWAADSIRLSPVR